VVYRCLADAVVIFHLAFIAFVLLGALLVAWRRWVAFLHVPAIVWGALVEINAWICPLTPWEQHLRMLAGQSGYEGGFVEHYLIPVLYPAGLDPRIQLELGIVVIVINALLYGWVLRGMRRRGS
jgi:hypothetical protein